MPPVNSSIEARYRYANRLLAALTLQAGGELRIPMNFVRTIEQEDKRQALMEDSNFETQEIVLRLFTKHAALYPVESDTCASPKLPSVTTSQPQLSKPEVQQSVRPPMTEEQLLKLQRSLNAKLMRIRIQKDQALREKEQENLSSILEVNSPGYER